MSQQQSKAEHALATRAAACDKPRAVAKYLSDFADALLDADIAHEVVCEILVAATPVVTEYAMKGIFK